ncbi:single-stranded DNA-binding protein [Paraburkholderia adhaesiva]|uniref:single-stranded DNA-binding protein n=1 Tax=Paraburkholderia adhaesiva TaxID=2883244 RepID=UPI0027E5B142|nr:single-stranded DNA-binding protein [Paraburkholderia adhaesiva]
MTVAQYVPVARTAPAMLATFATATAVCLSVLAGWQRGGWLAERALWVAIGVVLVLAAHLLPALCWRQPWAMRMAGAALWLCCLAATCYEHAGFFTLAQQHAGKARAATVADPLVEVTAAANARNPAPIAAERARVRAATGDGEALFVNVITFSDSTGTALLALADGDSVSLAGSLTQKVWTDRHGEARPALDMVAHAVLTAYHVTRKRKAVTGEVSSPGKAPARENDSPAGGMSDDDL